jgi:sugar transferase (PEP-CTERM/EpsH1 system associated)
MNKKHSKILYLAHRIPYPPNKGDKIRTFNEIKYLSQDHGIDLVCLADNIDDISFKKDLELYCQQVFVLPLPTSLAKLQGIISLILGKAISVGYFYKRKLQRIIDRLLKENHYDAIICFSSPMAEYIYRSKFYNENKHRPIGQRTRLIMDFCDVDSDKWLQYAQTAKFPMNLAYRIENKRLFEYEKQVSNDFDFSVFTTNKEVDLFLAGHPVAKNLMSIPNGVDFQYFSPGAENPKENIQDKRFVIKDVHNKNNDIRDKGPILLFTGSMDYYANVEGVSWFNAEILPLIKRKLPQAQFLIVGSNPHPIVKKLGENDGVIVTGFVDDIRPYYQMADICVIPLRLARGVQNKVLEAMSMGKPVVVTSKAVEGIMAVAGEHVFVQDTPDSFSEAVFRLFRDNSLKERMGMHARKFILDNYDWECNIKKFNELLG